MHQCTLGLHWLESRKGGSWTSMAEQASCILGRFRGSIASRTKEVILPLCLALVRHIWSVFWIPQYKEDMDILEKVPQKTMKMVKGLKHLSYEKGLTELELQPRERSGRSYQSIYKCPMDGRQGSRAAFSAALCQDTVDTD